MRDYRTTIAGLCAVIAGALGSGILVDIPANVRPYLVLAATVIGAIGLFLAADAKAAAAPPASPPAADDAKPAPKVPPVVIGVLSALFFALAFVGCGALLTGCATPRDGAVTAINVAADFGTEAERTLEALDKGEQEAALERASSGDEARVAVAAVRVRYRRAWAAYRGYRAAWLASAASLHVYDAAAALGKQRDLARLLALVGSLTEAERVLADAAAALGGAP